MKPIGRNMKAARGPLVILGDFRILVRGSYRVDGGQCILVRLYPESCDGIFRSIQFCSRTAIVVDRSGLICNVFNFPGDLYSIVSVKGISTGSTSRPKDCVSQSRRTSPSIL